MTTIKTVLTTIGQAKITNAIIFGESLGITQMALGDGVIIPVDTMSALSHEVWRGDLDSLVIDAQNPDLIVARVTVPDNVGGWTVRECGLYDSNDFLVAIGNVAEAEKVTGYVSLTVTMVVAIGSDDISGITLTPAGPYIHFSEKGMPGGVATMEDLDGHKANIENPHSVTKAQVGLSNVDNTSDADKPVSTAQAEADASTLASARSYADGLVVGLLDDRGNFDASVNAFPSTGGSGDAGAILKGDTWIVSVSGTPPGTPVGAGDWLRALTDAPGNTATNWAKTVDEGLSAIPTMTMLGNNTGGSAVPIALTQTQVRAIALPQPLKFDDTAPAVANTIDAASVRSYAWGTGHKLGGASYGAIDCAILSGLTNIIVDLVSGATGSVICGGTLNKINASYCAVLGGHTNLIGVTGYGTASYGVVVGGRENKINGGTYSVVVGGYQNVVGGSAGTTHSVVVGGDRNVVSQGNKHFIGGGQQNTLDGANTGVVVGGALNKILGSTTATHGAFIGGGYDNWAGHASLTADYSVVVGGYSNRSQAMKTFIGGGNANAISTGAQESSIVGGDTNTITAGSECFIGGGFSNTISASNAAICGGYDNTVAASDAFVGGGRGNTASGMGAVVVGGTGCTASGANSSAAGYTAHTQGRRGAFVESSGSITTYGDSQLVRMTLRGQTTDATAKVLAADTLNAASAATTFSLMTYQTCVVKGLVVARDPAALADWAIWEFTAMINQDANAASTSLLAAVTPTLLGSGGTGNTWALTVTADTTIGGLAITATGEAAKTVTWGCKLDGLEVRDIA